MVIVRFPPAKEPSAAWRRIAPRSTSTSLNVASPTWNVCASPTIWRFPLVQITAAVGAAGVTGPVSPAAGVVGAEALGTLVEGVECKADSGAGAGAAAAAAAAVAVAGRALAGADEGVVDAG